MGLQRTKGSLIDRREGFVLDVGWQDEWLWLFDGIALIKTTVLLLLLD